MQHQQLNATVNRSKDKRYRIALRTITGHCGTAVTGVGLCNGKHVSEYISMKSVIILVILMIVIVTVSTVM